jgi:hypothetical protein
VEIDYVFVSRELIPRVTAESVVDTGELSDHHALVVEVDLAACHGTCQEPAVCWDSFVSGALFEAVGPSSVGYEQDGSRSVGLRGAYFLLPNASATRDASRG